MLATLPLANILGDFGEIIAGSSPFAKSIILILFILSVVSWAVMVERYRRLDRVEKANREFWARLETESPGGGQPEELARWCEETPQSPLAELFLFYHREFQPAHRGKMSQTGEELTRGLLRRGLDRVATAKVEEFETGVTWLATLSSVAPFLGLLGTVWGIMGSFLQIGRQGTATLDAVGPGIAEALVTTVCGLFVAIPAVVGYNWLVRRIRHQESEMLRLMGILEDRLVLAEIAMEEDGGGQARVGSFS